MLALRNPKHFEIITVWEGYSIRKTMRLSGLVVIWVVSHTAVDCSRRRGQNTRILYQQVVTTMVISKEILRRYRSRSSVECSVRALPEKGVFYFVYRRDICDLHRNVSMKVCEEGLKRLPDGKYMRKKVSGKSCLLQHL
jgi:hypothetical protein